MPLNQLKIVFILIALVPQIVVAKADDCNLRGDSPATLAGEVKAAALMGDENRKKFGDFATEETPLDQLTKAFSASGGLNCPYTDGSAQITGANDVMTTAAHMFFDEKCNKIPGADQCYFFKPEEPNTKYFVDLSTIKSGKDASGECYSDNRYFDWVVVKLKTPVDGVTPYEVPSTDPIINVGDTMVSVSHGDNNFKKGGLNIHVCEAKALWFYDNVPIQTNCDTGGGASGSGQFILTNGKLSLDSKKLILTSIHVGKGPRTVDGKEYNDKDQYNMSVPVETEFLQAIKSLAGK